MFINLARLLVLAALHLTLAAALSAQATKPDPATLEAMRKLDRWVGEWKGKGWAQMGPGQRHEFTITESIQRRLQGTVLLIHGLGKDQDGAIAHDALAVLAYDPASKQYRFRSWRLPGGQFRDSEAKLTPEGMEWGFHDGGNAPRIRFNIRLTESGQWIESGELSFDGQAWRKFMEMTLERSKESR